VRDFSILGDAPSASLRNAYVKRNPTKLFIKSMTQLTVNTKKLKDLIGSDKFKSEMALALPKHLTPDRMARVALTTLLKTPKLGECDPASVMQALMTCSQHGIEPDGRRAHLIPYGKQCQLIIDYKGIVELVMRSGNISYIHADVIYANDEFDYDRGELKAHKYDLGGDRGDLVGCYALCRFKDGTEKCEVMSKAEVEAIRVRSKAGKSGPWVTDWNEMAKKTAFRRLSKWLPMDGEVREAFESDDTQFKFNKPKRAAATHSDIFTENVAAEEAEEATP